MARVEALPEGMEYRDTGCEVAPRCLECPLPRCKYDEPPRETRRVRQARVRRRRARALREKGFTPQQIASVLGVARRQVFRYLEGE